MRRKFFIAQERESWKEREVQEEHSRKEKNEKEMKEESILFLPVTCAPRREGRGRQGESAKDKEKGGGGIRAHV